jgi:hypothetical protein
MNGSGRRACQFERDVIALATSAWLLFDIAASTLRRARCPSVGTSKGFGHRR